MICMFILKTQREQLLFTNKLKCLLRFYFQGVHFSVLREAFLWGRSSVTNTHQYVPNTLHSQRLLNARVITNFQIVLYKFS